MNVGSTLDQSRWYGRWTEALAACTRLGGSTHALVVSQPATLAEIADAESALGLPLPESLRRVFADFSSEVDFAWYLDLNLPTPFDQIFSGGGCWGLRHLTRLEETRRSWISAVFPNPADPYDCVWHEKLAVLDVPNGDLIAIDLEPSAQGSVVYLSHDGGEGHGVQLGTDFADFISRWSELGCPGPEDWQWLPFLDDNKGPLQTDTTSARAWRRCFGMTEPVRNGAP